MARPPPFAYIHTVTMRRQLLTEWKETSSIKGQQTNLLLLLPFQQQSSVVNQRQRRKREGEDVIADEWMNLQPRSSKKENYYH